MIKYTFISTATIGNGIPKFDFLLLLLYGGMRSSIQVCAGVCGGVSIASFNETCHIDIRSIDD